ncbi:hypothetical protein [Arthrobacter sp. YC-RL1]|uniref:hypothetical protein n=1 Tax=Arthrobacter sp. YC-RL1 TaxID=1652545 RepID=UPI001E635A5C|nr:hypothetical protein [Arthrobacter sp. YC-RL1]
MFHEIADTYKWIPAANSPAALDAAALPSPDPQITDPTGETGHRLIAEAIQIFLLSASGHLGGLAGLYQSAEVLFSPPLLIRAVIENCAHAVWILGDDPNEPAEKRLARVYLEELKSAEEARKNTGRLQNKTGPTYERVDNAYKKLKKEILSRFPQATKQELGDWTLEGEKLPSLEIAVKWMYSLTEAAGGTINQDAASGVYGLLSNLTHPTLYPVREQRRWVYDVANDQATADLYVDVESVVKDARAAIAAFYNSLTYVISYFGWSTQAMAALEEKIEVVIPDFIR